MDEINYRRFFDINDLAAIRLEEPDVFGAVHALIFDLIKRGVINGLRVGSSGWPLRAREILRGASRRLQRQSAAPNGRAIRDFRPTVLCRGRKDPDEK